MYVVSFLPELASLSNDERSRKLCTHDEQRNEADFLVDDIKGYSKLREVISLSTMTISLNKLLGD